MISEIQDKTILYIDDERANLDGFRFNFRKHYTIFVADNTTEAFEIIEKNDIKIVLSDNKMPDMLGTEFFEKLSASHPDIIRILVTAYADTDAVMQAINKGNVYKFIAKPWNKNELQVALENAFEAYYLKSQNVRLIKSLTSKNDELENLNFRLRVEVAERKKAEEELAEHRDNLERLVDQRTEEIAKINNQLAMANNELVAANQELNAINEELEQANKRLNHEIKIRQQVQEMLTESENKFRSFIEQSSEGLMLSNHEGIIIDCNKAVEEIMEIKLESIINVPIWEFDFNTAPEELKTFEHKAYIEKEVKKYLQNLDQKESFKLEGYRLTSKGTKKYISSIIFPVITPRGKFIGRLIQDQTDKKLKDEELRRYKEELEELVKERTTQLQESEQRLRTLSDNLPGGAIYRGYTLPDDTDHLVYASASIEEISGLSTEALLGSIGLFFNKIHPEDIVRLTEARRISLQSLALLDVELRYLRNPNDLRWLHLRIMYRRNADNNIWFDGYMIDITNRKLAEQAIIERENAIKSIQEGIASTTGEKLFETIVLKLNESLAADFTLIAELSTVNPKYLQSISISSNNEILPNIEYSFEHTPCKNVLQNKAISYKSGVLNDFPHANLLKELGAEGYVGVPLFDSKNKIIGIMVSIFCKPIEDLRFCEQMLNIFSSRVGAEIERLKADAALKEREIRFRALFELSPNWTFITRTDGIITEANSSFIEMTEYFRKEIIGSTLTSLGIITRDDNFRIIEKLKNNERARNIELPFYNQKKQVFHSLMSVEPVLINGEKNLLYTVVDISDRKKAEEAIQQYSDVANNMQVGLNVFQMLDTNDPASAVLIKTNPAAERILGLKNYDSLGRKIKDIYPQLSGYGIEDILKKVLNTGKPYQNEEFRFFTENGNILFFTLQAFRMPNSCIGVLFEDNTRKKLVEKAVKENEERYRVLFDKSPDGIHLIGTNADNAGKIVSVNPKVCEMLGYTNAELTGMKIENLMQDLSSDERLRWTEKLMKGETVKYETYFYRKDGSRYPVEVTASIISLGDQLYILGIDRDITDIVEAGKKLQENIQFLSTLLETIPLPVFYKDIDGNYLGCNSIFESYTGYKREHLIGKKAHDLFPADLAAIYEKADNELFAGKKTQRYEGKMVYADGSLRDIIFNKARFTDAEGNDIGLIGAMFDITDRKKSEQVIRESEHKLLNIFNSSSDGILITDFNFNIIDLNQTLLKMVGFENKELIDKKPLDMVPAEYHATIIERVEMIKRDENPGSLELEVYNTRGELIPIEVSSKVIEHGSDNALLTIIRDITDRKNIEKKLLETIISTEERERERFAGDLHDEVGPLLSSLKMYISLLGETEDKKKKDYIIPQIHTLIREAIQTVREISNDLSPHVLNNYGCVAAINSFLGLKRDFLSISFVQNLENKRFTQNKEIMIYRIVKELVNNTIKHAEATHIDIQLIEEGNQIRLSFKDNGIGFDINQSVSNNKGSIGLLNIMSRIKTIDGKYKITSSKGRGFSFSLSFPL